METSVLILLVDRHYTVFLMVYDDDAVYEAYFRVVILLVNRDFYTHRMKAEEVESNKVLLHHDVIGVAGDVGVRCCKGVAIASSQRAVPREALELAVFGNHSGRKQAEAVPGCCYRDLAALLRSHMNTEQMNRGEDLSKHLHVDALELMKQVKPSMTFVYLY